MCVEGCYCPQGTFLQVARVTTGSATNFARKFAKYDLKANKHFVALKTHYEQVVSKGKKIKRISDSAYY